MNKPPTAQEVAELAGVSQSAVSRSFTNGASVSEITRNKVLKAAAKLGYRPNAIARSLITRRSCIVALVMSYLENQFYPQVIERLSQQLQQRGYHVLMFISDMEDTDVVMAEILQYQVDGIVLASTSISAQMTASCTSAQVPVVQFNRVSDLRGYSRHTVSSVTSDNYRGGRIVAELLASRGYRRIGFLAGLENSSTSIERERGLKDGLAEAGLVISARAVGHYNFESAKAAVRQLFSSRRSHIDALFAANDHMAIAAMDVIRHELGMGIPDDIGVVGFDDVPQAAWSSYRLTTMIQSVEQMVDQTVALLMQQMQGKAQRHHVVIPCTLVERESLRSPQQRSKPQKRR